MRHAGKPALCQPSLLQQQQVQGRLAHAFRAAMLCQWLSPQDLTTVPTPLHSQSELYPSRSWPSALLQLAHPTPVSIHQQKHY